MWRCPAVFFSIKKSRGDGRKTMGTEGTKGLDPCLRNAELGSIVPPSLALLLFTLPSHLSSFLHQHSWSLQHDTNSARHRAVIPMKVAVILGLFGVRLGAPTDKPQRLSGFTQYKLTFNSWTIQNVCFGAAGGCFPSCDSLTWLCTHYM